MTAMQPLILALNSKNGKTSMTVNFDRYNACLNSHGEYNSFQFVLRLSPLVHNRIEKFSTAILAGDDISDFEDVVAFSTYIHETIHWWQHIGSSIGFLMHLSYPLQMQANFKHLNNLLKLSKPQKSILRMAEIASESGIPNALVNQIVNNFFDIEFFRMLVTSTADANQIVNNTFFECESHSYVTAYGNTLTLLALKFDPEFKVVPKPDNWMPEVERLREQKVQGFYYGSPIDLSPIGTLEIFEGQARFSQIQYLHFASNNTLDWTYFEQRGMFTDRYTKAFNLFMQISNLDPPTSCADSIVGLFLLVCDMSLNPGEGFPFSLFDVSNFVRDVTPGRRFINICLAIAKDKNFYSSAISAFSKEEYILVSGKLAQNLQVAHPLAVAEAIAKWSTSTNEFIELMQNYESFNYSNSDLPICLLTSHLIAFNIDKAEQPHFFCWPGAWMAGTRVSQAHIPLFEKHAALFIDKEDDDGIVPRLHRHRDDKLVQDVFERFYGAVVLYDMTRQWILSNNEFSYEYDWLSSTGTQEELREYARKNFEILYGVCPDKFEILR